MPAFTLVEAVRDPDLLRLDRWTPIPLDEAVEVPGPMGDEGEEHRPAPEQQQGIEFQIFIYPGRSVGSGLHQTGDPEDPAAIGPDPEEGLDQVHLITQIPDFLIDVEGLRGHDNSQVIMTLELEEIADSRIKIFEASIVPDHTYLINNDQRLRRERAVTDIRIINLLRTQNIFSREDIPALGTIPAGILGKQRRFAGTFFAKDEDQLIGIEIRSGQEVPDQDDNQDTESNLENNHIYLVRPSRIKDLIHLKERQNSQTPKTVRERMDSC